MSPSRREPEETIWEIMVRCCAGLDVHKDSVEACVRGTEREGKLDHRAEGTEVHRGKSANRH